LLLETSPCARQKTYYAYYTHTNGNERQKPNEDRNKNIDEQKPPYHYQITNDKPEHLRRLYNETQITKTLHHTSGSTSRSNENTLMEEKWRKLPTVKERHGTSTMGKVWIGLSVK
jgi:hypothetical protein